MTGDIDRDFRGRSGYLDLLIATLTEHDKNMDKHLNKMDKLSQNLNKLLSENVKKEGKGSPSHPPDGKGDSLTYLRIKLNRPLDEVIRILEALKKEE
ncbi:hypothetical protein DRO55_05070 [Candidatus Bathyarchaeota archaeon]|nr:MAG: hypothetical protein DRO55_05070 [Candidatus Bathyarchaeota archaeon]